MPHPTRPVVLRRTVGVDTRPKRGDRPLDPSRCNGRSNLEPDATGQVQPARNNPAAARYGAPMRGSGKQHPQISAAYPEQVTALNRTVVTARETEPVNLSLLRVNDHDLINLMHRVDRKLLPVSPRGDSTSATSAAVGFHCAA